jgi:hypothetical protein
MSAKDYQVVYVVDQTLGKDTPGWLVGLAKPDGTMHSHHMPKLTLVARSVEYGIDIEDEETLWDVAIHEPFMVHPYDEMYLAVHGPDPAVALGLVVPSAPGGQMGVTCYTADTIEDARTAHLARLDHCRQSIVVVTDRKNHRAPVLKHREPWQVEAYIENSFRAARKAEARRIKEARSAAAKR